MEGILLHQCLTLTQTGPFWIGKRNGNIKCCVAIGPVISWSLGSPWCSVLYDVRGLLPNTAEGTVTLLAGSGQLDATSPFAA